MDETIRIYKPRNEYIKKETNMTNTNAIKSNQSRYDTITVVFNENEEKIRNMVFRHPWVNIVYNWIIVGIIILLTISFISWGIRISNDRKVASMFALAMADFDAEQLAKEEEAAEARRQLEQSEAFVEQKMAESLGLMYQGADKFTDKYGYSERDFKTYGRCVFNRVENPAYSNDIFEVINQDDQWVGYNKNAALQDKYYQMALRHIKEWRHETTKPCSNDYLWAELTPNGIYLKNNFHADGYAIRWRAD